MTTPRPVFFAAPAGFRKWLQQHGAAERELFVGYYRKSTGKLTLTWQESVDEALCFGWIDGVRRRIDDERYMNRFTPRTSRSTWSAVNIRRAKELIASGRMRTAGRKAFEARADERSAIYAYEQHHAAALSRGLEREFRADAKAWSAFRAMAPSYRRSATYWVMSAKKEETRRRRLAILISDSAAGRKVPPLRPA